jgi:hypothetical protein
MTNPLNHTSIALPTGVFPEAAMQVIERALPPRPLDEKPPG